MYPTAAGDGARSRALVPVLFTGTLFLSASLLFFVQPLFAKIVLPRLGGAPAVWTTAMLFFQTVLIAGYFYAHLSARYLAPRHQLALHGLLWAAALWFLPLGVPDGWRLDPSGSIAWQTLALFAAGVGLPFAVLSANAPLLQSWYARTGRADAADPYFLYGASNAGSLIALLAFPLAAEPLFGARAIGLGWAGGFLLLGAGLLTSGLLARGGRADSPEAAGASGRVPPRLVLLWLLLSFVPSSLMLAVTTKIGTDLGSVPLVWVVPLALYLLTFVLTFTRRRLFPPALLEGLALAGLLVLAVIFTGTAGSPVTVASAALLVAAFVAVALSCHAALYGARPPHGHLTLFYVVMSVGGALGGLFNSLIAPAVFDGLREGILTTGLAAMAVLGRRMGLTRRAVLAGLAAGAAASAAIRGAAALFPAAPLVPAIALPVAAAALALLLRRQGPALLVAGAMAAGTAVLLLPDAALFRDRSFFGTHLVADREGLRLYANGSTIHGAERLSDLEGGAAPTPLFYYHPNGPLAQVLSSAPGRAARSVGIVGLGVGSLACHARPGQDWEFYEIDPVVDRVARDPALFTFMSRCGAGMPTHLGDARVVLEGQERAFDILVIDAFGSDSVPLHLLSHQAMQLYLDRLAPEGLLVYHISTRYYDLERPLGRSAAALGLAARIQDYQGNQSADPGDTPSRVVAIARSAAVLDGFAPGPLWQPVADDGGRIWTDDYANLLGVLR